jgi:hypothetical protein
MENYDSDSYYDRSSIYSDESSDFIPFQARSLSDENYSENSLLSTYVSEPDEPRKSIPYFNDPQERRNVYKQALMEKYNSYIDKFFYLEQMSEDALSRINNEDPKTRQDLPESNKLSDSEKDKLINYYSELKKDLNKFETTLQYFDELDNIILKHQGAVRLAATFGKDKIPSPDAISKAFIFLTSPVLSPQEKLFKRQLLGAGKRKSKKSAKRSYKKKSHKKSYKKSVKHSYKKKSTKRSYKKSRRSRKSKY